MNTIDYVTFAELRSKLGAIPVKLILCGILVYAMGGDYVRKNILGALVMGCVFYSLISIIWWSVRATGNWLIGIILGFAIFFGGLFFMNSKFQSMGENYRLLESIIGILALFGGVLLDASRVVRYFRLRKRIMIAETMGQEEYDAYEETRETSGETQSVNPENTMSFFQGCNSEASIKKRYKDLSKVYHPDSGNGSGEVFARINSEYEILMKQFKDKNE